MKRTLLRLVLIALVLCEFWLLAGFLPQRWQESMYDRLNTVWPSHSYDYSRVTHPNLDAELRPVRPVGMALLTVLAVANGVAIVALWRGPNA